MKLHERFCISNYQLYRTGHFSGVKDGISISVRNSIPHNHVDLSPLVSVEATGVCIPIGIRDVGFAGVVMKIL
jgi:hypothetical protein